MATTRGRPDTAYLRGTVLGGSPQRLGANARSESESNARPEVPGAAEIIAELRALRRSIDKLGDVRHTAGQGVDILSRLPPSTVTPVVSVGVVDYVNTVGTYRIVADLAAPAGSALIITRVRPELVYQDANDNLITAPNPYFFVGGADALPYVFRIRMDGGLGPGEFSLRYRSLSAVPAQELDVSGLFVLSSVPSLLGWESGLYRALVRGGGRFTVDLTILSAYNPGAQAPDFAVVEVGGYRVPEDLAMRIFNNQPPPLWTS